MCQETHTHTVGQALKVDTFSVSPYRNLVTSTVLMDGQRKDATHSTIWLMPRPLLMNYAKLCPRERSHMFIMKTAGVLEIPRVMPNELHVTGRRDTQHSAMEGGGEKKYNLLSCNRMHSSGNLDWGLTGLGFHCFSRDQRLCQSSMHTAGCLESHAAPNSSRDRSKIKGISLTGQEKTVQRLYNVLSVFILFFFSGSKRHLFLTKNSWALYKNTKDFSGCKVKSASAFTRTQSMFHESIYPPKYPLLLLLCRRPCANIDPSGHLINLQVQHNYQIMIQYLWHATKGEVPLVRMRVSLSVALSFYPRNHQTNFNKTPIKSLRYMSTTA